MAADASGNFYVADTANNRIRKVIPGGVITSVAGNGTQGYSGDGGAATSAQLNSVVGLAVDSAGALYFAGYYNSSVRKVSPEGIITTIAGGRAGYSGDGGPATSAALNGPVGVAIDGSGAVYVADQQNYRVRKISPSGTITTIAGNGIRGFSGDGGPATSAQLDVSFHIAVDAAGSLYIADASNLRVRKVSPDGIIRTVAGKGAFGLSGDGGPAIESELTPRRVSRRIPRATSTSRTAIAFEKLERTELSALSRARRRAGIVATGDPRRMRNWAWPLASLSIVPARSM